jgi:hypothetical protein
LGWSNSSFSYFKALLSYLTLATNYSPVHIGKTTTETGTQRPPTVTSTPGKAEALLGLRTRKTYFTLAFDLEPADLTDGLALPTSMPMDRGPGPTSKESATSGTAPLKKRNKKWKGVFHVHNPSLFLKEGNQKRKKKNWAMFPEGGRLLSGQQSSTSSRLLYDGLPCILGSARSSTLRPSK